MTPWLRRIVRACAFVSAGVGLTQILLPGFALAALGAESTATTQHEHAIIGMMLIGFAGLAWQSSRQSAENATGLLWAAVQKAGMVVFMGVGMVKGVFGDSALAVMALDAIAGAALFTLLIRVRGGASS